MAARTTRHTERRRRGVSLLEMVVAAFILSFIVAATAGLYGVGQAQHRTARGYSQAQTDMRAALNRITRTLRHGYTAVVGSSAGSLAGMSSNAQQIIVRVPEPGVTTQTEIRFHRAANGEVYFQRQGDPAPGTRLITGVQAMTFQYFRTDAATMGTSTVPVNAAPETATEVQITMTAVRGPATTTVTAYVTLRNALGGGF